MRDSYPYNLALNDLKNMLSKHIKHESELNHILEILDKCSKQKTVAIRGIYEEFMAYRKKYSDYSTFTEDEKKMWDDLFYFWG